MHGIAAVCSKSLIVELMNPVEMHSDLLRNLQAVLQRGSSSPVPPPAGHSGATSPPGLYFDQ